MQKYISYKFNKKILCILILFAVVLTTFSFIPNLMIKSYATTYTYNKNTKNLPSDFNNTYPGYQSLLQSLITEHPNWTFKLYETGLDWNTVINNEYLGHGSSPKNLVPSDYSSEWICSICGKRGYDATGRWYCASRGAIEYVMDPRNSLNNTNIFQYLLLSFDNNITQKQVNEMASKIPYLNTDEIKKAIYDAGRESNINPFYIIGKILQEQGSNGSVMCAGKGYNGKYKGVYNLFNVGASGNGNDEVILNGLKYAQSKGWTTPKASILGGIGLIKTYINRGQDTLYYQKFNVKCKSYYQNQYAQNIFDAQNIGKILKGYYNDANLMGSQFTFEIPLYKNMPSSPVKSPSISSVQGELAYVNANGSLALRDAPGGNTIAYVSEGTQVVITKRASSKINGYYWDQVSTPQGTGYMAREAQDGSKTYLVTVKQYEISGNEIIVAPGTSISAIPGAKNTGSTFGTGAKITLEGKTYELVVLGDCSGDGEITASDYVKVRNKIMGSNNLSNVQSKSADVNKDGNVTAADYVKVRNQIMGSSRISL